MTNPSVLENIKVTQNDSEVMRMVIGVSLVLILVCVFSIAFRKRMNPLEINERYLNKFVGSLVIAALAMVTTTIAPFVYFLKTNDMDGMHSYVYCFQIARLNYCVYTSLVAIYVFALLLVVSQMFYFNWQMVFIVVVICVSLMALKPTFSTKGIAHLLAIVTGLFALILFMIFSGRSPWWLILLLFIPATCAYIWYQVAPKELPPGTYDYTYGVPAQAIYLTGSVVPIMVFSIWLLFMPWIPRQKYADYFILN